MPDLLAELDEQSSQIRFDTIDFSCGELVRLHQDREIQIQPAFQRLFRWTTDQQGRLIESMILGLPVPQIVLFQREDGVLELIDGLQRISSIIRFVTGRSPNEADDEQKEPATLEGCDILAALNGRKYVDMPSVLQLELKRKTLRAIVIRRTNDPSLRYEMFKRLNAGGSIAEAHEVRNAALRIFGKSGEDFLEFLARCSEHAGFTTSTDTLSEQSKQRLGRQELILRFFALKNSIGTYKGHISDWLDAYSESVVNGKVEFNYETEWNIFDPFFTLLSEKFGDDAFVKHKTGRALGGLAPAYYDAVTMGVLPLTSRLAKVDATTAKQILAEAVDQDNREFRDNVGPGANAAPRLNKRIAEVTRVFDARLPV